ncbi:MAG: transposase [Clostridiales bacterium]|nr:transposase [Clostridiales bacterium]
MSLIFLRSLVERGLKGGKRVIPDAHEGLKKAMAEVLPGPAGRGKGDDRPGGLST